MPRAMIKIKHPVRSEVSRHCSGVGWTLLFAGCYGGRFQLLIETNGKFKWYLAVGSLDQYAEGHGGKMATALV